MSDPALWAEAAVDITGQAGLPLVILGGASDQSGDAAMVANLLRMSGERFGHVDSMEYLTRAVYLIATDEDFSEYRFPLGTSVIDPFGTIRKQIGVRVYALTEPEIPSAMTDFSDDPEIQQLLLDL